MELDERVRTLRRSVQIREINAAIVPLKHYPYKELGGTSLQKRKGKKVQRGKS